MTRGKSVEEQKLDLLAQAVYNMLVHLKFPHNAKHFFDQWQKIDAEAETQAYE